MKKKVFSALLAFALIASLSSVSALAEGTAVPNAEAAPAFDDVVSGEWYYDAVRFAVQNGLMEGVSDQLFAPQDAMTRTALVTALYSLDGSKKTDAPAAFPDVAASAPYCDAVEWAAANGIAAGYGDGTFGVKNDVTRQQMAVMFQRYAKYKGRSTENTADLSAYADASDVADSARGAMGWAVSEGLIAGTGHLMLMPDGPATRAQTAAILMRYVNGSTLEKRTADYVSQFVKSNFSEFCQDCDTKLRQSITQDELVKGWNTILQVAGTPGETLSSIYARQKGCDVVVSTVACTLYNLKVTITYDGDGKPAGIWTNYTPKNPPTPQSTDQWEEVSVKVGDYKLPGMLTLPKGVQEPPVVILIQGSGSSDMNESLGTAPNRPFEDIAHGLAEQGVATLRYNKRTYQYPAGGGDTIEYEMLDDAAAAVKLLGSDSRVDVNRIYLLGHSLGGMMAPKIAADNPQVKGIISMAGTLRTLQDLSLDQNKAAIAAATSLTEQQKSAMLAQVQAELDKTKTLNDGGTGTIMGMPTNYWKSLNAINSADIVKSLNVPMLILQGDADFQVYPDKDYKLWQTALEGRGNVTFKLYDGLSHLFMPNQIPANGAPDISVYNAPNHVDSRVIADIAAWVEKCSASQWVQLDRLHYTKGTVQSFLKNADGTGALSLKVIKNYHSGTDPVDNPDSPFPVGTTQSFILQKYAEKDLSAGAEIVVYDCGVSLKSNPDQQFIGAAVLYYEKGGKYYDVNGKEASLPPADDPAFSEVFQ
jgi:dienelactone hydrolase